MQERHPLAGDAMAAQKSAPVIFRLAADSARFSFRIDPGEIAMASKAFGLALPARIGDMTAAEGKIAVCLGPDEWYLITPLAAQEAVESAFAALYADAPHSLTDIGHREVGIEIDGAAAVLALQSAVPFDVEAMPTPSGCRTIFDKAQIVLIRKAEHRFHIEVWRSFADHVWGLLQTARREIELKI